MTTGRIHGSDIWHNIDAEWLDRSTAEPMVKLLCTGRNVRRVRVMLDIEGQNVTCLRCQQKAERKTVLQRWGHGEAVER
jgi:hypothetical protein